jgi:hypothetical protein
MAIRELVPYAYGTTTQTLESNQSPSIFSFLVLFAAALLNPAIRAQNFSNASPYKAFIMLPYTLRNVASPSKPGLDH